MRAVIGFNYAKSDQLLDEELRQRPVDGEMQRALGDRISSEFVRERRKDGSAEWQIAEVILESRKAGDGAAADAKCRHTVGNHLFGVWDDVEDGAPQHLKRAALRLLDAAQILVDFLGGHAWRSLERLCQERRSATSRRDRPFTRGRDGSPLRLWNRRPTCNRFAEVYDGGNGSSSGCCRCGSI